MDRDATLLFIHIPKTAGSTLIPILRRQYPRQRIYEVKGDLEASLSRFRSLDSEARGSFRLIAGHIPFGLHEDVPGSSTYVTMLRDPVERVISTYFFAREHSGHFAHERIVERGMTLIDVLESGIIPMLDNGQVRQLSSDDHLERVPYGACDRSMLTRARRNIDRHVSLVGVTEHFDESLLLMKEQFGWRDVFYERRNTNPGRPTRDEISSEALGLIRELNALDLRLYDECVRLLRGTVEDRGYPFAWRVAGFRAANGVRGAGLSGYRRIRRAVG